MRVKRWSEGTFRIDDAWTDRVVLSVPVMDVLRLSRFSVEVNGKRQNLVPKRLRGSWVELSEVRFPFDEQLVTRFRVFSGSDSLRAECREEGDRTKMLFEHDPSAIHRNIQRRGALKEGKGFQLVCSLQAYLWAESPEGAARLETDSEHLKALSVAFCSSSYRLMERPSRFTEADITLREKRAASLTEGLDVTTPAARWYPSVKLAIAQLLLVAGDIEGCVRHLIDISDRQEAILESEPICAFNIALANCLLVAILDRRQDPRLETYEGRWEHVFRVYPQRMDLRFGTMEEFGKIYEACMLTYKLRLERQNCRDARFRPTSLEEVLDTCLRVRVPGPYVRRIVASIGGQPRPQASRKRPAITRLRRWIREL